MDRPRDLDRESFYPGWGKNQANSAKIHGALVLDAFRPLFFGVKMPTGYLKEKPTKVPLAAAHFVFGALATHAV